MRMKKARTLLGLGIWVSILSFLGFPQSWKDVLFLLTGFGLIYFSYILYKESKETEKIELKKIDSFSENIKDL